MKEKVHYAMGTKKIQVRNTRFPMGLFGIIFVIMLLMSGVHMGLVLWMTTLNMSDIIKTMVPILYWGSISLGVTLYTRKRMKETYDEPLQVLAKAMDEVAQGDFSVYVSPFHTPDQLDYLDIMIMDFNKMVEELGSIETLKTDFFSNVSHEIKTPLAVISSEAQLMKVQGGINDEQREQIEQILAASKRLSNLITNILKLNRLEKQSIQPDAKVYDVCEQICQCVLQFENLWEEKEIELDIEMEDQAYTKADESLMELVWNNLMSNAVKFTGQGGQIRIKETSTESDIIITITDSGCGMSEETIHHVFDKFYQGDTSHATEGNGLGLALVYRILQLTDAEIDVASEVNHGTTFQVTMKKEISFAETDGKMPSIGSQTFYS